MYTFGKTSLQALQGIHPNLVKVIKAALENSPFDFTVTDGVRTVAQQQALYAKGRTKPGEIVTMRDGVKSKSNHQPKADGYGYAVDLYPYTNGKVDYNDSTGRLSIIAEVIKAQAKKLGVKVIWGGDWTVAKDGLVDRPHFELR